MGWTNRCLFFQLNWFYQLFGQQRRINQKVSFWYAVRNAKYFVAGCISTASGGWERTREETDRKNEFQRLSERTNERARNLVILITGRGLSSVWASGRFFLFSFFLLQLLFSVLIVRHGRYKTKNMLRRRKKNDRASLDSTNSLNRDFDCITLDFVYKCVWKFLKS